MFTSQERARLRSELLKRAAMDERITGAAITGSVAVGREDKWSDIDLAFGVADPDDIPGVLSAWTSIMYREHGAVHHVDVNRGVWVYRVFLLASTLQVDIAVAPRDEFRALAPSFLLVHGKANEPRHVRPADSDGIIGLAWLYALHARSSIARRRLWQAEYMISGVRDHALALACLRHSLPAVDGRGIDDLPNDAIAPFESSFVRGLDSDELTRAFRIVVTGLLSEITFADEKLAERVKGPLTVLSEFTRETSA